MPTDNDPTATQNSGFSEDQRAELEAIISKVVGGAKPPDPPAPKAKPVTDDDWDNMTDRQRESWVRQVVDDVLDGLARDDADRRRDAEIEALKQAKNTDPENTPDPATPLDRLRKWLWGEQQP